MSLNLRFKRRVAMALLAALAFAQASVSLADCSMDRGTLVQAMTQEDESPCELGRHVKTDGPKYANRCVAHCTADAQIPVVPVAIVRAAADAPVLFVASVERRAVRPAGLQGPAPGTPPPRILLHSFLI